MELLQQLFEPALYREFTEVAELRSFKEGETIMQLGQRISSIPIVKKGAIRVMRQSENGENLLLYFLENADTCSVTLKCCSGGKNSDIIAVAETDVEVYMLPADKMNTWLQQYHTWREYILNSYSQRIEELLHAVDVLAFQQLDKRLLQLLKDKAVFKGNNLLNITHQELAENLHTNRVVVSRLLKKFELSGTVKLGRNSVEVASI
jgi:CRP/FNR family transcriptional regulator